MAVTEVRRDSGHEFTILRNEAVGPERCYTVGEQEWTVCEVVDPISLTRVLIFTSTGVGRRVRHYPTNWRQLSIDELHALSWER